MAATYAVLIGIGGAVGWYLWYTHKAKANAEASNADGEARAPMEVAVAAEGARGDIPLRVEASEDAAGRVDGQAPTDGGPVDGQPPTDSGPVDAEPVSDTAGVVYEHPQTDFGITAPVDTEPPKDAANIVDEHPPTGPGPIGEVSQPAQEVRGVGGRGEGAESSAGGFGTTVADGGGEARGIDMIATCALDTDQTAVPPFDESAHTFASLSPMATSDDEIRVVKHAEDNPEAVSLPRPTKGEKPTAKGHETDKSHKKEKSKEKHSKHKEKKSKGGKDKSKDRKEKSKKKGSRSKKKEKHSKAHK